MIVVQGPTVLPVGLGGDCSELLFFLVYHFFSFFLSLEMACDGLKYCLKRPFTLVYSEWFFLPVSGNGLAMD